MRMIVAKSNHHEGHEGWPRQVASEPHGLDLSRSRHAPSIGRPPLAAMASRMASEKTRTRKKYTCDLVFSFTTLDAPGGAGLSDRRRHGQPSCPSWLILTSIDG
jgi:hypothetical protein